MIRRITKVTRNDSKRAREGLKVDLRKGDGDRIRELRVNLKISQEAFARQCGVSRISASAWESGKSSPAPRNWRQMARLAGKAAPSTALWFWEKAGIDRDTFEDLFPEFERLARDSEQRIRKQLKSTVSEVVIVPLIRAPLRVRWPASPSPEQVEDYFPLPKAMIQTNDSVIALRITAEFIRPLFNLGDAVVIDTSGTAIHNLEGQLVAAVYIQNSETKDLAERHNRRYPIAGYRNGRWPHLFDGIYLGWLRLEPPVSGMRMRQMNLNSSKLGTEQPAQLGLEFSVPVAMIDEPSPGERIIVKESEAHVLGRIICWIAGPKMLMCGSETADGGNSSMRKTGE
jgi:transcriptional regulator with XRE-family HTH domain